MKGYEGRGYLEEQKQVANSHVKKNDDKLCA